MEQNRGDTADAAVMASIRAVLAILEQKAKAVREAIRRHIDGNPGLKQRAGLPDPSPASARPPPPGC